MRGLIGSSRAMAHLRAEIGKAARSDRPVLVQGPTGSGKELVARAIHDLGPAPHAPLIDFNCGAVPEALMEGQFFGWERGAFTGAERQHEGLLTGAGQGTLFLDEIGELPPPLQAKLLRVLETRRFRPLGSRSDKLFAGRIVAATHVDLEERARIGGFREDLYYRLEVLRLRVPALEERRGDIPELVRHFARLQPRLLCFTEEAIRVLCTASWPGNVRQLRNAIDRLAVFSDEDLITPVGMREILGELAPAETAHGGRSLEVAARAVLASSAPNKLAGIHDAVIDHALALAAGNRSLAARLLGVDRKVVERRLAARSRQRARSA